MSQPDCLVYDLYLSTLGGGERVMLTIADALAADFSVTVAAPRIPDRRRLRDIGLPCDLPFEAMAPWRFPAASRRADLVVYLANGVPLPSFAARSLLMLQFPFEPLSRFAALAAGSRWCIDRYEILTYSQFASDWVGRRWQRPTTVLHPPVSAPLTTGRAKENLILSVGRFFAVEHCKRQDVLLDAYAALPRVLRKEWRLVLAGGSNDSAGSAAYLSTLQARAESLDVEIMVDLPQPALHALYERASLFWHATGFGRDAKHPERAEHFGITAAEAMSYGAVPMVFADGGQTEVVDERCGVLWNTVDELVEGTIAVIGDDPLRHAMQGAAREKSLQFGEKRFRDTVRRMAASGAAGDQPWLP